VVLPDCPPNCVPAGVGRHCRAGGIHLGDAMTTLRQAAQQALEALEDLQGGCTDSDDGTVEALTVWCPQVIADLRSALAQPEQERNT